MEELTRIAMVVAGLVPVLLAAGLVGCDACGSAIRHHRHPEPPQEDPQLGPSVQLSLASTASREPSVSATRAGGRPALAASTPIRSTTSA